jgi:uracil-DNA glycosylase
MQPSNSLIPLTWNEVMRPMFESPGFQRTQDFVKFLYNQKSPIIYPSQEDIYKAFKLTPFNSVHTVIIGQDPYHNGNADGLAFSCKNQISPSLKKIFERVDYETRPAFGKVPDYDFTQINLERWATQGIFLLNTFLTVEANKPNSHSEIGWHHVTKYAVTALAKYSTRITFLLWGNFAQSNFYNAIYKYALSNNHMIVKAEHPAAAAYANREWYSNHCFGIANARLKMINKKLIW